jgi:hypothetical protein
MEIVSRQSISQLFGFQSGMIMKAPHGLAEKAVAQGLIIFASVSSNEVV